MEGQKNKRNSRQVVLCQGDKSELEAITGRKYEHINPFDIERKKAERGFYLNDFDGRQYYMVRGTPLREVNGKSKKNLAETI